MYDQSKKLASCHLFDDIRWKRKTTLIRTIRKEQPEMWLLFLFGRLARCVGFVPLRGYGFEIAGRTAYRIGQPSFRPLAGFLLLSFPRRYGGSGKQREPMGALVPCIHF